MWLCLNDAFLSIVNKDSARGELLVRARRKGDIERIFPGAKVTKTPKADYLFRASIPTEKIIAALEGEVRRIVYSNFKDSVKDDELHRAYNRVWNAMMPLQKEGAYVFKDRFASGLTQDFLSDLASAPQSVRKRPKQRKKKS